MVGDDAGMEPQRSTVTHPPPMALIAGHSNGLPARECWRLKIDRVAVLPARSALQHPVPHH